jgi:hypothetical protein
MCLPSMTASGDYCALMSASGTKRTSQCAQLMSAFGCKADMADIRVAAL